MDEKEDELVILSGNRFAQNGGTLAPYDLLDVDLNGRAVALEDGIVMTRYLFGVRP